MTTEKTSEQMMNKTMDVMAAAKAIIGMHTPLATSSRRPSMNSGTSVTFGKKAKSIAVTT